MKLRTAHQYRHTRNSNDSGHVLLMILVMLGVALIIMGGLYSYSASNAKLNDHSANYLSATAAAEACSEKVLAQINADYRNYGGNYVLNHLGTYRKLVPTGADSPEWDNYEFMDLSGQSDRVEIDYTIVNDFANLGGKYGALKAFKNTARILSNARKKNSLDGVVGSVYQDVEMSQIPIFQYAIFYNVVLEFTPLPNMTITGPVHCNTNIYNNPAGTLTYKSDVTASGTIVEGPNPNSNLPAAGGPVVYGTTNNDSGVSTLSLPIGTNNSPSAVHQVLEIPPVTENPLSLLGRQRYYNQTDMMILVSNANVVVESGRWDNFNTQVPTNEWMVFLSTTNSFYSKREGKTIRAIQLDIGLLDEWNKTNTSIRKWLPTRDVRSIYVADLSTMASTNESGVRLTNGLTLPPQGLTIATPAPVYVQGDYNVAAGQRGSTNTTGSLPASIACDAITILSTNWNDANSKQGLSSRVAGDTTVNTAIIAGIVASTPSADSGGVENFPRFLEDWMPGGVQKTLTCNGSMVCMTYSQVATNIWQLPAVSGGPDHYNPPIRNWSLDQNFQYADKLPPCTPALMVLVRSNWRIPAAFTTNILAGF